MARRVQLAVVAAALLAAVGLPSLPATAAAGQAPPSAPVTAKHAQAHQATAELTAMGRAVLARVRVPADVAPSLVPASRWRRDALLSIARSNPVGIADLLLPDDMLAALGAIPGNELEKKVRLRGTYSLEHREDAQGQATFTPHVVTGSGRVTVVFSDGKLPTARTGADIEVDAYQLDPQTAIAHAAGSTTTTTATSSATSTPTPLGPMGVAVILANFSDSSTSLDANVPKAAFQGSPGSDINSWYSENSYGKASLNASFFGPYTIADATSSGACPDLGVAGGHLLTKANPYLTYSRYRRIIMIFNCTGYGASTSVGEAPLSTPQGTITGAVTYMDANSTSDRYVFAHELAHNLGNLHAAFFACQPSAFVPPTRFGDNCSSAEYGDEFDTLGSTKSSPRALPHLGAHHKSHAGWLSENNHVTVSTPGTTTFKLLPYETGTSGLQALTIPRGTSGTAFTLEYRQAVGFDAWMASGNTTFCDGACTATRGPLLKLVAAQGGSGGGSDTQAIDTTPNSITSSSYSPVEDNRDGALLPGRTFTDPEYGISITTQNADATGATVTVSVPSSATCSRTAPTVTRMSPVTQTVTTAQPLTYTVRVTSNDAASCSSQEYRYAGGALSAYSDSGANAQFTAVGSPDRFTLAPGARTDVAVTLRPGSTVVAGAYSFATTPSRGIGWIQADSLQVNDVAVPNVTFNVEGAADTTAPSPTSAMSAQVLGSAVASVSWKPSTDDLGVVGYRVVVDNASLYEVAQPSFLARQLAAATTHVVSVQAFDRQGNLSPATTVSFATPVRTDTAAPVAPGDLTASVADRSVVLSWPASRDNTAVIGYLVSPFNVWVPAGRTSVTLSELATSTRYQPRVQAVDAAGNLSPAAESSISLTTARPGTQAPTQPSGLISPTATGPSGVTLSWAVSSAPAGVAGYYVFRNGRRWATVTSPSYTDPASGLYATGAGYQYSVQAYDTAGNISPSTPRLQTISSDSTASDTSAPTGSALSAPAAGATVFGTVSLATAPTDDIAVAGVEFYVDGKFLGRSTASPFRYDWNTSNTWNGSHTAYARAYDAAGNYGTAGTTSFTVLNGPADRTAPTAPGGIAGTAVSAAQVNVSWTASSDDVGVSGYTVYRNGAVAGTVTGSSWSDTDVAESTSYTYSVVAFDAAGNTSSASGTAAVTTPGAADTTAPTAVAGLVATAVSPSQVNLTWAVSQDDVGVTGYRVYRNGLAAATSTTANWSDGSLSPSTTHTYYVVAVDAAGNTSTPSSAVSVTTAAAATKGAIAGTVTSGSTGAGLANVKIATTVNGVKKSYYTGSAGTYSIPDLPPGSYALTFTAKGSRSQTKSATVTAGQTTKVDVSL